MKRYYVGRVSILLGLAVVVAAYAESSLANEKSPATKKQWSCTPECGFSLTTRNLTEAVEVVQQHQRKQHDNFQTDDETRAEIEKGGAAK